MITIIREVAADTPERQFIQTVKAFVQDRPECLPDLLQAILAGGMGAMTRQQAEWAQSGSNVVGIMPADMPVYPVERLAQIMAVS